MQQVADWLEKLSLGQYAQRFAENDIDLSVLPHLTDADLEKKSASRWGIGKDVAAIGDDKFVIAGYSANLLTATPPLAEAWRKIGQ